MTDRKKLINTCGYHRRDEERTELSAVAFVVLVAPGGESNLAAMNVVKGLSTVRTKDARRSMSDVLTGCAAAEPRA